MVVVPPDHVVDLKALADTLKVSGLGFASAPRLQKYLGIEPGAVSLLAVYNDSENQVEIVLDDSFDAVAAFQCHPLVNTITLVVARPDLERFFEATGHRVRFVAVPRRSPEATQA